MVRDWKFFVLLAMSLAAAALTAYNYWLDRTNRELQAEIAARQTFLEESVRISQFSNQLIQALANLAAQSNDENLTKLLADHGVTFTLNLPQRSAEEGSNDE